MRTGTVQIGRVIRVGRGWADVTIEHKVRRVNTRPDLLVKVGSCLTISNEIGISILPSGAGSSPRVFH
jgi:hypothetical protein